MSLWTPPRTHTRGLQADARLTALLEAVRKQYEQEHPQGETQGKTQGKAHTSQHASLGLAQHGRNGELVLAVQLLLQGRALLQVQDGLVLRPHLYLLPAEHAPSGPRLPAGASATAAAATAATTAATT